MVKVVEEAVMAKHIDHNLVQVGGGAVLIKIVVQMGVRGCVLIVIYRGGNVTDAGDYFIYINRSID